jgi:hypothetical protein
MPRGELQRIAELLKESELRLQRLRGDDDPEVVAERRQIERTRELLRTRLADIRHDLEAERDQSAA